MAKARTGRVVFGVNAAVSVALVVLVAAIALVVRPPAPPGIAAFAPQATKPITKAPLGQSSVNGSGTGACAAGQRCTAAGKKATPPPVSTPGASAAPLATGVPSALQCYTWPDGSVTQTFDPQSPPCIASWPDAAKGNGGATTQGVTATQIRIAVPSADSQSQMRGFQQLTQFFNTHFELYGRQLVLSPFDSRQLASSEGVNYSDPTAQKADAEGAAALKPFAATDFLDGPEGIYSIPLPEYVDTLARHHVITSSGGNLPPNSGTLDAHAPYEWSYLPTLQTVFRGVAGLTCRQLVGHPAMHSPSMSTQTRKFALVLTDPSKLGGSYPGQSQALRQLSACGIKEPPVIYFRDADSAPDQSLQANMTKLRSQGVTTLLYLPDSSIQGTPQQAAQNIGYFPEWVAFGGNPTLITNLLAGPKAQTDNTFGIAGWDKSLSPSVQPWHTAYLEAGGANTDSIRSGKAFYQELQLIASGIQMAGPHLTPDSFGQALRGTSFPNPGAGRAPAYQPGVDYQQGGHETVRDFAGYWFDTAASYGTLATDYARQDYELAQNFCWVDLGVRWAPDAWPRTDHFRQGRCR
jgi:hypothetical protein